MPDNPRGWLIRVGSHKLTDLLRSEQARRRREDAVAAQTIALEPEAVPPEPASEPSPEQDTLILLFMCCHPALTPSSQIALTLRAVGGLTTDEIARAFLVPSSTMGQRISRAKQKVKASGMPFRLPPKGERTARLAAVLHVLYLIFNEGYTSSSGASVFRTDLSAEAIRLVREVHRVLPDDGEVTGLLALMVLTDARRAARADANGDLIPLEDQDRAKWDAELIAEGVALVTTAMTQTPLGPYQLQAAIAALHDEAATAADTDWPQILALYGVLLRIADNPMVRLNHAVATAMVQGPQAGLDLLAELDDDARTAQHHRLDAVRAHLYERLGDLEAATAHYRAAARRTTSIPERRYLEARADRVGRESDSHER